VKKNKIDFVQREREREREREKLQPIDSVLVATAASWVKKVRGGRKLGFSDRQLQIFDGKDYECLKFQF